MSAQTEEGRLLELAQRIVKQAGGRGAKLKFDRAEVGEERVSLFDGEMLVGSMSRANWELLKVESEQGLEAALAKGAAQAANKRAPRTKRASKAPNRCPSCAGKAYSPRPVSLGQLCQDLFHAPKEGAVQ